MSRQWALLIPSWIMVCVVYVYIAYFSLNLYHTPALSSMTCITDTQGKLHPFFKKKNQDSNGGNCGSYTPYSIIHNEPDREDDYIPPLYDLPVGLINQAVFGTRQGDD